MRNFNLNTLEAVKSASSFLLKAGLHIEGLDQALAVIDTAVLLAFLSSGLLNVVIEWLNSDSLEAFKGTSAFLFEALRNISSQNNALAHINGTVLLASFVFIIANVLDNGLVPLCNECHTLKAVKSTSSFLLKTGLHIEGLDEALAVIDTAVLLTNFTGTLNLRGAVVVMVSLWCDNESFEAF